MRNAHPPGGLGPLPRAAKYWKRSRATCLEARSSSLGGCVKRPSEEDHCRNSGFHRHHIRGRFAGWYPRGHLFWTKRGQYVRPSKLQFSSHLSRDKRCLSHRKNIRSNNAPQRRKLFMDIELQPSQSELNPSSGSRRPGPRFSQGQDDDSRPSKRC